MRERISYILGPKYSQAHVRERERSYAYLKMDKTKKEWNIQVTESRLHQK